MPCKVPFGQTELYQSENRLASYSQRVCTNSRCEYNGLILDPESGTESAGELLFGRWDERSGGRKRHHVLMLLQRTAGIAVSVYS